MSTAIIRGNKNKGKLIDLKNLFTQLQKVIKTFYEQLIGKCRTKTK